MDVVFWIATGAFLTLGSTAHASDLVTCTAEPPNKWISETDMKGRITALGYRIDVFKVTPGGCYQIYGRDSSGKRVEVYFSPLTGDAVKSSKSEAPRARKPLPPALAAGRCAGRWPDRGGGSGGAVPAWAFGAA